MRDQNLESMNHRAGQQGQRSEGNEGQGKECLERGLDEIGENERASETVGL